MRWIGRVGVILILLVLLSVTLLSPAVLGADVCSTCVSCGQGTGYYAPACGCPCYIGQPGCCENPPSPCDNAWDGYCQEKARRDAFWSRVGTGTALCRTSSCSCGSCSSTLCFEQPTDAMPAVAPESPSVDVAPVVPLTPPVAPLPFEPTALSEPSALPPDLQPASAKADQPWYRSWLPRISAG